MNHRPKLLPELEIIASDEGFIVHDALRDVVHYLNQTSALVLSLCTGDKTVSDIATVLKDHYDLDQAPEIDVSSVIEKFAAEGLVEWRSP